MRSVFGRRTVAEAVFLVAVPVIVLTAGQSPAVIIAAAGIAYLVVLLLEVGIWRTRPEARTAPDVPAPAPVVPETVRVLPAAEAAQTSDPVPVPVAPEPVLEAEPQPEPVAKREPEHVRVLRPAPEPEPEADPEPEVPPAAVEPPVVPVSIGGGPRRWNLWDLERLVREHSGEDEARDEERSFLLMYLRDFAGPDGLLPIDFDGLVRDSFGDLVGLR